MGKGENLPFASDMFDFVLFFDILEHVNDVEKVFSDQIMIKYSINLNPNQLVYLDIRELQPFFVLIVIYTGKGGGFDAQ